MDTFILYLIGAVVMVWVGYQVTERWRTLERIKNLQQYVRLLGTAAVLAFVVELYARVKWPISTDALLNNVHPWQYLVAGVLICKAYIRGYEAGVKSER